MSEFTVGQLRSLDVENRDLRGIRLLLKEFSPKSKRLEKSELRHVCENAALFVARTKRGRVIGMATLVWYRKPTGRVGLVEDVIATAAVRGQGVGKQLMLALVARAKLLGLKHVELTSNPKRVVARKLYLSLGFQLRDTGCFRLKL